MRPLILAVTLLTITGFLFSCNEKGKKTNTDIQNNAESVEQSAEKAVKNNSQETVVFNWVKPTTSNNRVLRVSDGNSQRHTLDVTNANNIFSVSKNKIKMHLPVTNASMKIVGATNVTSAKFNAIVVHLDGNSGQPTLGIKASHIIEAEFQLKKLFPDDTKLLADKMIIVKILHDNNPAAVSEMTSCLKDCILKETSTYNDYNYDCKCDELVPKGVNAEPKEVDGSILKGGN